MQKSDINSLPEGHQKRKVLVAGLSVFSNATLTILKIVIGLWTGSVSILSEAVHSGTDLLASCIALFSVRASDTPPDEDHPYGHGKIESLSGLAEAMLILTAAGYICYEIISHLRSPSVIQPKGLSIGILIMGISMFTNLLVSRYLFRVAKLTDSQALQADASHLFTDVITSLGVFAGLILVRITHFSWLDPIVAAAVAVVLITTAFRLTRSAVQLLLDTRLPEAEEAAIRKILEEDPRVLGYHKLRTRKSGSLRHADVHVQLEDEYTLVFAHQIAEEVEDAIRAALPATIINIHIEPYAEEIQHQLQVHGVLMEPLNGKSTENVCVPKSKEMPGTRELGN